MLIAGKEKLGVFSLKTVKKAIVVLIAILLFDFFLFPMPILASELAESTNISAENTILAEEMIVQNHLPESGPGEVSWEAYHTVSAYNSETSQTDGSPCITATMFNVCEHGEEDTVAANFLRHGTRIRIPELFGDRVFVVRDRMNSRYDSRIDIWMKEKVEAKKFGLKWTKIEILE